MGSTMQEVSKIFFVAFWVFSFTHVKSQDIECVAPEIPHGITNPAILYKENDIIQYKCEENYQPRPGKPKCTKYGWSMKPECEEIVCILGLPTGGVYSTEPKGVSVFHVGERVKITCLKTYWFSGTKQVSRSVVCQKDGTWSSRPVCDEMTCEKPEEEHLVLSYYYRYKQIYQLNANIQYTCEAGYKGGPSSRCTENGWDPKPECIEITCSKPIIDYGTVENPQITYRADTHVLIQCDDGYTFYAICTRNGVWQSTGKCNPKSSACAPFSLTHGFTRKSDRGYLYTCDSDYKTFDGKWWGEVTCQGGHWSDTPQCIHQNCPTPPYVENAVITSYEVGTSQQSVTYECRENYSITGQKKIYCINKMWENAPTCTLTNLRRCPLPENNINNSAWNRANRKAFYKEGDTTEYKCNEGFRFEAQSFAKCSAGKWTYPQCIEVIVTDLPRCPLPENNINNATWSRANRKAYYMEGDTTEYKCNEGYHFQGQSFAKCSAGKWTYPQCL